MQEAGALIELIQAPVGTLVEEIDGTRLVHADVPVRAEILILLHSHYPDTVRVEHVIKSLSRRNAATVRNRLHDLHKQKLVHGDTKSGYRLTRAGHNTANSEIKAVRRLSSFLHSRAIGPFGRTALLTEVAWGAQSMRLVQISET